MAQVPPPPWLTAWHAQHGTQVPEPTPPDPDAPPPVPRGPGGRFLPGVGGNPTGTPGKRLRDLNKLRAMMQEDGEAIAAKVIQLAKAGNLDACGMVLARLAPPLRPQGRQVQFQFNLSAPLMVQAQQVVSAVAEGSLTVEEGHMLVQCLSNAAGLKAVDELGARLAALEGKGGQAARTFASGMVIGDVDAEGNLQ